MLSRRTGKPPPIAVNDVPPTREASLAAVGAHQAAGRMMLLSARMSSTQRPATVNNANASNTTDVALTNTVAAVKAASLHSLSG
jgi:hypothetical protein